MKLTSEQVELQGTCATRSLTALQDLERARGSVADVVHSMSNYCQSLEDPEERNIWMGVRANWSRTYDQLTATIKQLREGS